LKSAPEASGSELTLFQSGYFCLERSNGAQLELLDLILLAIL
jgi:hypothetical protein